jgi:hypothetical protein
MNSPLEYREALLRYALDEMLADERAKIDEALITDPEFSDAFQEARCDLIDAYVADELTPEARKRVERAFFSIQDGQTALSMALDMRSRDVAQGEMGATVLDVRDKKKTAAQTRGRNIRVAFFVSTVATLAACFLLAFVLFHARQASHAPSTALPAQADNTVVGEHGPVRPPVPLNPAAAKHGAVPKENSVLAVAMPMGAVRGIQSVPIRIRPGARQIKVQWPVPSDSTASGHMLEISTGQSIVLAVPQDGPVLRIEGIRVANFLLPAGKLSDGKFLFRLVTAGPSGHSLLAEVPVHISR